MIITFTSVLFAVSIFTNTICASGISYNADELQEQTAWCWVACARGLAEQEGIVTATQEEAVEYVKGAVVNAGGSLEELTRAANYFSKGNGFVALYRPLTFEEIVSSIDDGHIISASCGYFIGNYRMGGHSVLIIGYDVRKEKQYLHYYDPLTGETTEITYQYFCERPAGGKTLRYQYSVFYTEDEAMIASAAELAKE
jgi:hypothetical protein